MLNDATLIRKEHDKIEIILSEIEKYINNFKNYELSVIKNNLAKFSRTWDAHEKNEDALFSLLKQNGKISEYECMQIKEHKQLRGHWEVLRNAMSSQDKVQLMVALDTDGRMLIDKFRDHIKKKMR